MNVVEAKGNLFDPAFGFDAIGHGVNCFGMMGAGIAVLFKHQYPDMYKSYRKMCEGGWLRPGQVMPYTVPVEIPGPGVVYNIASQFRPGPDAKIEYLEAGLYWVRMHMELVRMQHLGLPWIGAGIGGLDIKDVMYSVRGIFDDSDVKVTVVEFGG